MIYGKDCAVEYFEDKTTIGHLESIPLYKTEVEKKIEIDKERK